MKTTYIFVIFFMISQYNRHSNKIYPLSQRGFRQAERNNSHQIWTLLSWTEQDSSESISKPLQDTLTTNFQQISTNEIANDQTNDQNKKSVSFKLSKNDNEEDANKKKINQDSRKPSADRKKTKSILLNSTNGIDKSTSGEKKEESQLQKLKKKSIEKYIKDQVPYSRTMSNSAFRKFYQRPCPQTYGSRNIKNSGGVCYGGFMKTHNIQPHTLDNKPQTYQTYTSALNFGKRTKLDLEDRWKRIERQLSKNLDYRQLAKIKAIGQVEMSEDNKEAILKENINVYGQKKGSAYPELAKTGLSKTTKSLEKLTTKGTLKLHDEDEDSRQKRRPKSSQKPLYFIYKYKQEGDDYNCTRYARDRHGITCYVDNCFRQNDEAFLNFQKKIKPIYAEKCKPEDVNIDAIRLKNHQESKEHQYPRHYLTPCVEVPYVASNYSRKKSNSICETTA